ncbi:Uncharacterised protein [Streptococcus pneumoniae]|nr:Uncharacterised protein [Streptococcus pneumoniae]
MHFYIQNSTLIARITGITIEEELLNDDEEYLMLYLTRKTTRYAGGGVIKRHMMPDHVHMLAVPPNISEICT